MATPQHWDDVIEHADYGSKAGSVPPTTSPPRGGAGRRQSNKQNAGQPDNGQDGTEDTGSLGCRCTTKGRALVVCFDGTTNRFGENNTNVIELYRRIVKSEDQLVYYGSGIGTGTGPHSSRYWRRVVFNTIDKAIAWGFKGLISDGYRWLSQQYKEGDRIYLFGFSRGAYQVRVLAAMIYKVGLIRSGNEGQITRAYELYAESEGTRNPSMAAEFKATFSRKDVWVHFLGVWDTVSSVGVTRSKLLPFTNRCEHFCYMRHALALDEQRVKFLPEYACGDGVRVPDKLGYPPRIKEVWFAGSHSDIGGGAQNHDEFNLAAISAWWMGNESRKAGLDLHPARAIWDWNMIKHNQPTWPSLVWHVLEALPVKHLTYEDGDSTGTTRWPHGSSPRIIKPGQKIHASVAFMENYSPLAKFSKGAPNKWDDIIGKGNIIGLEWTRALGDLLELDLLDHSDIPNIMIQLSGRQSHTKIELLDRLALMARGEGGAYAITNNPNFKALLGFLDDENSDTDVKIATCELLAALASQGAISSVLTKLETVFGLLNGGNTDAPVIIAASDVLAALASHDEGAGAIISDSKFRTLFNLLDEDDSVKITALNVLAALASQDEGARAIISDSKFRAFLNLLDVQNDSVKIATLNVLAALVSQGGTEAIPGPNFATVFNLLNNEHDDAGVKIAASRVLVALASHEGGARAITSSPYFETLFNLLDYKNTGADVKINTSHVLAMLASHEAGARAIINDPHFEILFNLLNDERGGAAVIIAASGVLTALASYEGGARVIVGANFATLFNLLDDEYRDAGVITAASGILTALASHEGGARAIVDNPNFEIIFNHLNDESSDAVVKIAALHVLAALASHEGEARAITSDPKFGVLFNLLSDEYSDADVKIAASDVLVALARQGYIFDHNVAIQAIFRLIVESNKKLQNAGLKALTLHAATSVSKGNTGKINMSGDFNW